LLGETVSDADGKWMLISEVVLQAGTYELNLKNNSQALASQTIEINLDFILLPPKIFAGKSEVFHENQPAFFGNTFYGSRIIAFFDQAAVAIIADNSLGDFVIKPSHNLKVGNHTLTLFTELADGSKSPTREINFIIEEAPKSTAPISFWRDWSSRQNQLILAALGILTIAGFFLLRKKRN
jgi:LPXTG-motif cell wall-anchored protein